MNLFFAGDICISESGNEKKIIVAENLKKIIRASDISVCNLEGCIKSTIPPTDKRGPHLSSDTNTIHLLKDAGFNLVALANNHIMDYGVEGLKHTINLIEREKLNHCGAGTTCEDIYKPFVIDGDVSVGIVNVCEKQFGITEGSRPGVAWMLDRKIYEIINGLNCDYIIVLCHCGAENLQVPLPQVRELYKQFIDFGADLVIGNHPHVIQGYELYKGKNIYYSLGNFLMPMEDEKLRTSLCLEVIAQKTELKIKEIFTRYDGNIVNLYENGRNSFDTATENLFEGYNNSVYEYCKDAYYSYFEDYFCNAIGLDIRNKDKMKLFLEYRESGEKLRYDNLFMYHNSIIETNRWIMENAIK